MASPVVESDIVILSEVAPICDRLKALLNVPAQLKSFLGWALTSAGEVSDEFVVSIADRLTPIGTIVLWGGTGLPSDRWLICNGQTISPTTYATLFSRYGILWGGDGITGFRLPDMQNRVPMGASGSAVVGAYGGTLDHTTTIDLTHYHGVGIGSTSSSADIALTARTWAQGANGTTSTWFVTGDDPGGTQAAIESGDVATTYGITETGTGLMDEVQVTIVPVHARLYFIIKAL